MALYVYGDETEFEVQTPGGVERYVGSGLLVTRDPIDAQVINDALSALDADPDRQKPKFKVPDQRTLDRAYFHACEDSQNGHSHLCRSICKRVCGTFLYSYTRYDPAAGQVGEGPRGVGAFQEIELTLASLGLLQREQPLHFLLEERGGFGVARAREWLDSFFTTIERSIFDVPFDVVPFPRAEVAVANKSKPGLQVVDFILWAANRCHLQLPDTTWFGRLLPRPDFTLRSESGGERCGVYHLTESAIPDGVLYPNAAALIALELAQETGLNKGECFQRYRRVEGDLLKLDPTAIPAHAAHLAPLLQAARNGLLPGAQAPAAAIRQACSTYLRLFDTLPLYAAVPDDDMKSWREALSARQLAAVVGRTDLEQNIAVVAYLAQTRAAALAGNPDFFLHG